MKRSDLAIHRTCAGCRQGDGRDALLRFVLLGDPPSLTPDLRRRAPGRGASIHPRRACLDAAVRRGGFARTLRSQVRCETASLARAAIVQYDRRIDGLLLSARRAGHLALGQRAAQDAVGKRRARLLLVAADAGAARNQLERAAASLGDRGLLLRDKESLGRLFSRASLGVLAVLDEGLADELGTAVRAVAALAEES